MRLEFQKGAPIEDPSNLDIASELLKVGGERGAFATLSDAEQDYIQAGRFAGHADRFVLAYRDENTQYLAARTVSAEEVIASFQNYAYGRRGFRARHRWKERDRSTDVGSALGAVVPLFALLLVLLVLALVAV